MVFCVIRYFYQQKEPISEDNLSMQKESVLCLMDTKVNWVLDMATDARTYVQCLEIARDI